MEFEQGFVITAATTPQEQLLLSHPRLILAVWGSPFSFQPLHPSGREKFRMHYCSHHRVLRSSAILSAFICIQIHFHCAQQNQEGMRQTKETAGMKAGLQHEPSIALAFLEHLSELSQSSAGPAAPHRLHWLVTCGANVNDFSGGASASDVELRCYQGYLFRLLENESFLSSPSQRSSRNSPSTGRGSQTPCKFLGSSSWFLDLTLAAALVPTAVLFPLPTLPCRSAGFTADVD